jgi:hypothetical protein
VAQNVVGSQVNAGEKVAPTSLGHQIRPMGVVKGFCERSKTNGPYTQTQCQLKSGAEAPQCFLTNESTLLRWMLVKKEVLAGSISTAEA